MFGSVVSLGARHNNGMQRTRIQRYSHARLAAAGGSCAPLMQGVMPLR